jgi:hypothetical protein
LHRDGLIQQWKSKQQLIDGHTEARAIINKGRGEDACATSDRSSRAGVDAIRLRSSYTSVDLQARWVDFVIAHSMTREQTM